MPALKITKLRINLRLRLKLIWVGARQQYSELSKRKKRAKSKIPNLLK